ncbi:MAG: AMP-binding protein [Sphingobium sp.]
MPVIDGAMQDYSLTLDKFIDHAAKWHPDTQVVTALDGGGSSRIGYAGLRDRAARVSSALVGLGAARGDCVATLAWNTQSHIECWYGIMGIGAICHTLNPRLTTDQLAWMLDCSEASILFVSADLENLANTILRSAKNVRKMVIIDGDPRPSTHAEAWIRMTFDELLATGVADVPWGDFPEKAPCGLCFTSGTTGLPKGVVYTHRGNYLHTLRQAQADVSGILSRDVILPVVPMCHANAWGLPFVAPATGAKLVLPGRHADGPHLARLIADEGVTVGVAVPTVWLGLFDYLEESGMQVPTLRRVMVGGAPMPQTLVARIESRGIEVQTTWGMTELSPLGTAMPPNSGSRDARLSGKPAVGLDLRLADGSGKPLLNQREVEGHLWARGHSVVERYLGQTETASRDGWFDTGDLALIDRRGFLAITGRAKDLIKSGGEWINPAEIEALVSSLPDVALAAVVGRADPKWGERPVLFVELNDGMQPSDEDLLAPLRGKVANWWIPDAIVRLESMPLAATGKIDTLRLRMEYSRR